MRENVSQLSAPRASLQQRLGGGVPRRRSAGGRVPAGHAPASPPPGGIIERGAQDPRVGCPGPARACSRSPPRLCPSPAPTGPMERPAPSRLVPLPLLLLSSLSLLAARGRGAPGPRPRFSSPPGPALPGSLQLPMLRSALCASLRPGGHRTAPRAAISPQQYFRLGPNTHLATGTCFQYFHHPNRSCSGFSQPHSLLVQTARRPPAGPWGVGSTLY